MRPHGRTLAAGAAALSIAYPSAGRALDRPDSALLWLPEPYAELEAPDRLEERDPLRGLRFRADLRRGRATLRSVAGQLVSFGRAETRLAWMARSDGRGRLTVVSGPPAGAWSLAAGAFVAREGSPLFNEALGLARPARAPAAPRPSGPRFEPPRGSSSPMVRGAAGTVGSEQLGVWGLAGRSERLDRLWALGGRAARRSVETAVSVGGIREAGGASWLEPERRSGAAVARWAQGERRLAGELLITPGRGPDFLAEALGGTDAMRVAARWRRKPGGERPTVGTLAADARVGSSRLRVTWRPWSARALEDDGRFEMEAVGRPPGFGPCRVRVGGSSLERHVVADAAVAREPGRTFTLLVSRRESLAGGRRGVGSMVGGRLEMTERGRSGMTLLAQATRVGDAPGGSAWLEALTAAGSGTLLPRNRSGLSVSGHGWLRVGPVRFEALVADADPASGGRPADASLWVSWSRDDSN